MEMQDIIKNLRKSKGVTQTELANALNISQTTVAMWETGKRRPEGDMYPLLATFFGVTTDYLFGFSSPNLVINSDEREIIRTYRTLSPEGQQYIMQQIQIAARIYKKQSDSVSGVAIA